MAETKGKKIISKETAAQPSATNRLNMYLETDCTSIGINRWNELMKGARKANYQRLVKRIKKELPDLYDGLMLDFYNPWSDQCKQTRTHFILVHSAIEYFIKK
jgi:hypothetical protein